MFIYYCHICSIDLGIINPAVDYSLTGTQYQIDHFIKHTAPTGTEPGINSVFDDPSYESYRDCIMNTFVSGSAQVDDHGRSNLLLNAGRDIGVTLTGGRPTFPADTVKVVLHDNEDKVHSFPISSHTLGTPHCANCGAPVIIQK